MSAQAKAASHRGFDKGEVVEGAEVLEEAGEDYISHLYISCTPTVGIRAPISFWLGRNS